MNLPKAIEILDRCINNKPVIPSSNLHVAMRLGKEALKKIQYDRLPGSRPLYDKLPGETKE